MTDMDEMAFFLSLFIFIFIYSFYHDFTELFQAEASVT